MNRIEDELVTCPGCSRPMPTDALCECEDDVYGPLCIGLCCVRYHLTWSAA